MQEKELEEQKKKYALSEVDTRASHVEERLHSREKEGFVAWRSRKELPAERTTLQDDWHHEPLSTTEQASRVPVLATVAFFISMLMLGGALWYGWSIFHTQPQEVQSAPLLEVSGKKTLASGETLELQVVVKNELSVPLELAELVITYPPGTTSAENAGALVSDERLPLGTVAARSVRRGTVRAVLFGVNGEEKKIGLSLEYRVSGGNVIYQAPAEHLVTIGSNTFAISTDALSEVISGQSTDITVSITSQAKTATSNVLLSIEYPFGFSPQEVSPEQSGTNGQGVSVWRLGDFVPGETKKIYVRGTFIGEEGDSRLFKIVAGRATHANELRLDTPLADGEYMTTIKKPFLATQLLLDGKKPEAFSFAPGDPVKVTIEWRNTLSVPLTNVSLGVLVGGDALRKTGIKVTRGFYRSTDSQVLWDSQTKPETFKTVAPGASGTEEFQMFTLDSDALKGMDSPTVTLSVRASGKRVGESGVPESVEAVQAYDIPVQTHALFAAEARYFTSPFPQSGPLPPKVDTETVYAVQWAVSSSSSPIKNAVVTATLPPNVRFRNVRTPITENLVFDDKTRTVTWYAGDIPKTNLENGTEGKSVIFAVGLVPSASQVREEPDIVVGQNFTGVDAFTKKGIDITAENLNTILTEEGFDERFAPVVE